jgi:hypothetical protein
LLLGFQYGLGLPLELFLLSFSLFFSILGFKATLLLSNTLLLHLFLLFAVLFTLSLALDFGLSFCNDPLFLLILKLLKLCLFLFFDETSLAGLFSVTIFLLLLLIALSNNLGLSLLL